MTVSTIPDPALVMLVGASGAGKSTWAATHYRPEEIASSDDLRAVVGSGRHDLGASTDAFALLDTIAAARLGRRLTVVVDTLGLDVERRLRFLGLARTAGVAAVAVLVDTPSAACRARNRLRDRPVPAPVLDGQLAAMRDVEALLASEGWDRVVVLRPGDDARPAGGADVVPSQAPPGKPSPSGPSGPSGDDGRLRFVYQISRFPWAEDPAGWLADMVATAADAGFDGIAVMDHLIQIPQVGRAWDPLPEAYLTLGVLAGIAHTRGAELSFGTLVSPATFRSPGIVAKAVATLDVLTGGRAFCGIGAGWFEREHAAYGIDFPSPGRRLDRLEETAETLRAMWAPGTKPYDGARVTLPETTCYPRPVGDPPIIVGGGGEQRTLRIAARWGDACNVRSDLASIEHKVDVLRRHCRELDRDPDEVAVTVLDLPMLGVDRSDVAGLVEQHRGRLAAARFADLYPTGTAVDHVDRYRILQARGVSTVFVAPFGAGGPADVERFASVTAAFA